MLRPHDGNRMIVVFDMDNTLIHSHIDFAAIRRYIIAALIEARVLDQEPSDPRARSIPEWLALAEAKDPGLAERLWEMVDRFERQGMLVGNVERDVEPTLRLLHGWEYRLAVLTNNSLATAQAALQRFDLDSWFDLVLARGVVTEMKPSGAGVAMAHQALGGGDTFVVGDAYIDGLAAERANVGACFVAFRASEEHLEERGVHAWAHVQHFSELPPLLSTRRVQPSR